MGQENPRAQKALEIIAKARVPCELISHKAYGRKPELLSAIFGVTQEGVLRTLTFLSPEGKAVFALVPKMRQVDVRRLESASGVKGLRLATAPEVKRETGEDIGGVSPFGKEGRIFIEKDCLAEKYVLVAAGDPEESIKLPAESLLTLAKGQVF